MKFGIYSGILIFALFTLGYGLDDAYGDREPPKLMWISDEAGNAVPDVFVGKQYTIMDHFTSNIDQEFVYILQIKKDGQIIQNSNMTVTLSKGEDITLEFPWMPNQGSGAYIIKGTVLESFDSSVPLLPEVQLYVDVKSESKIPPDAYPACLCPDSPLKQLESGISPEDIECKEGLELIFKSTNGSPACVKPQTAEKLVERGWAVS